MDLKSRKRIAIVGAGPAGITAALALRDKGFSDITIFGKFEDAQLKTKHVDGITLDVAACFHHTGYSNTVLPLAKRYGINIGYFKNKPDVVSPYLKVLPVGPLYVMKIIALTLYYSFFFIGWLLLHKTPFRQRYFNSMTNFLQQRGMGFLLKTEAIGPASNTQGYGFPEEVSAYHYMRWFRPRLFLTVFFNLFKKGIGYLKEGYETLFRRILNDFDYEETFVKKIEKVSTKIHLTTHDGKKAIFDEVIIACPLDKVAFPHDHLIKEDTIQDTGLFSYLFTSPTPSKLKSLAMILEYSTAPVKDKILGYRYAGITNKGEHLYCGVGYKSKTISDELLKQKIEEQLREECGIIVSKVHYYRSFRYNLRFSFKALSEGLLEHFEQLQGVDNIWYSGGMMSHWDISSIYEHNKWLANKVAYKYQPKTIRNDFNFYWKNFLCYLRLI